MRRVGAEALCCWNMGGRERDERGERGGGGTRSCCPNPGRGVFRRFTLAEPLPPTSTLAEPVPPTFTLAERVTPTLAEAVLPTITLAEPVPPTKSLGIAQRHLKVRGAAACDEESIGDADRGRARANLEEHASSGDELAGGADGEDSPVRDSEMRVSAGARVEDHDDFRGNTGPLEYGGLDNNVTNEPNLAEEVDSSQQQVDVVVTGELGVGLGLDKAAVEPISEDRPEAVAVVVSDSREGERSGGEQRVKEEPAQARGQAAAAKLSRREKKKRKRRGRQQQELAARRELDRRTRTYLQEGGSVREGNKLVDDLSAASREEWLALMGPGARGRESELVSCQLSVVGTPAANGLDPVSLREHGDLSSRRSRPPGAGAEWEKRLSRSFAFQGREGLFCRGRRDRLRWNLLAWPGADVRRRSYFSALLIGAGVFEDPCRCDCAALIFIERDFGSRDG